MTIEERKLNYMTEDDRTEFENVKLETGQSK